MDQTAGFVSCRVTVYRNSIWNKRGLYLSFFIFGFIMSPRTCSSQLASIVVSSPLDISFFLKQWPWRQGCHMISHGNTLPNSILFQSRLLGKAILSGALTSLGDRRHWQSKVWYSSLTYSWPKVLWAWISEKPKLETFLFQTASAPSPCSSSLPYPSRSLIAKVWIPGLLLDLCDCGKVT